MQERSAHIIDPLILASSDASSPDSTIVVALLANHINIHGPPQGPPACHPDSQYRCARRCLMRFSPSPYSPFPNHHCSSPPPATLLPLAPGKQRVSAGPARSATSSSYIWLLSCGSRAK
eukprot:6505219-Pyramimonas_sp.AAC.1